MKVNIDKQVAELDRAITRLEKGQYPTHPASWCTNRIAWLWRFGMISELQKNQFADRMIRLFERMSEYGV